MLNKCKVHGLIGLAIPMNAPSHVCQSSIYFDNIEIQLVDLIFHGLSLLFVKKRRISKKMCPHDTPTERTRTVD
jgi:hypothetical protein